ncbi:TIGR00282 family metallophosphoesterase [candidate division WOR-3 bacterium]|nr:TIGR00282 family metallophosphoesterase [candidate division WOR-3 bacterium]
MKILFIGDVVGKPGMRMLSRIIPEYGKNNDYDLICINGENSAGGFGITKKGALKLKKYGCDVITTGNHIIDREEELAGVFMIENVIRPINYEPSFPGKGWTTIEKENIKIVIVNLQGTVFMPEKPKTLPPFKVIQERIEELREITTFIIVDIHAEATAEKIAMRYFLDGKVSAIIGTHTHVQTSDETVTKKGTAYITDVGMTGSFDSILGMQAEPIIRKFLGKEDERFKLAKMDVRMNAVEIEIDEKNGKAYSIRRLQVADDT